MGKPNFKDKSIAAKAGAKSKPGKHYKTIQWEMLQDKMLGEWADNILKWVGTLPPEKQYEIFKDLLNYFKPKMQSAEIHAEIKTEITDTILKAFDQVDEEIQPEPEIS